MLLLLPVCVIICIYGGSFGVIIMANLKSQRAANQVFPFIMLPQYFLAGVFTPIDNLPWFLNILSIISPMRYAVDLTRGIYYANQPEYTVVMLRHPLFNLTIMTIFFIAFMIIGTTLFVRKEQNR